VPIGRRLCPANRASVRVTAPSLPGFAESSRISVRVLCTPCLSGDSKCPEFASGVQAVPDQVAVILVRIHQTLNHPGVVI
jgi:hypothetical protein